MITVGATVPTGTITVGASNAVVAVAQASGAAQAQIFTSPLPEVTVADPSQAARITALESWRDNGNINGGVLM